MLSYPKPGLSNLIEDFSASARESERQMKSCRCLSMESVVCVGPTHHEWNNKCFFPGDGWNVASILIAALSLF